MAVFVGGIVAAVLGVILLLIWWVPFLQLVAGALPVMLLFGGVIAAYLGFDEVKEKLPYFSKKGDSMVYLPLPTLRFPEYYDEKNIMVPVVAYARITRSFPHTGDTVTECYVAGTCTHFPSVGYFIAKPECVERIDGGLFISIGCGEHLYSLSIIEYTILEDLREAQKPAIKQWKQRMKKLGYTGYV